MEEFEDENDEEEARESAKFSVPRAQTLGDEDDEDLYDYNEEEYEEVCTKADKVDPE